MAVAGIFGNTLASETIPNHGINLSAAGSSLVVAHADAATANTNPYDPWTVVEGVGANDVNSYVLTIPNCYLYADIFHVWDTNGAGTGPTVHAFGAMARPPGGMNYRQWPSDVDSTNYKDVTTNTELLAQTMWRPLTDKDGETALTLDATINICIQSTGSIFALGKPTFVWLAGCTHLLITVSGAGTANGQVAVQFNG